ncbi:MAG TPA: hypothetical protein VFX25_26885 [Streptosporangiaceae bacterium]|nr:hypothetical protein [Streptosporangiaceae bacterium]
MRLVIIALAAGTLGLAACGTTVAQAPAAPTVTKTATPAPSTPAPSTPAPSTPAPSTPAPSTPAPGTPAPSTPAPGTPAPSSSPATPSDPNVTDPWAVVSAYYGDIESGAYPQAWALLSSGAVTGQTYQQFVAGFSCTGGQQLTEQGTSGDQVSFTLAATDSCSGAVQHFSGTDTVSGGKIVAAHVTRTG